MNVIGNILWFILGGIVSGLSWAIAGLIWCITIVGIPVGIQCFKFSIVSFFPFGKEIEYGNGAVSLILNIVWILVSGLALALEHVIFGLLCAVTIIGIPFAAQHFKLAKLSLFPFGARIV